MGFETILAIVLLIALTLYALLGGGDFGAGVWHLLARGTFRRDQHHLIGEAIGPIWEANHVWLILIVTILFTSFPSAYSHISITLHIPLTFLVIGIALRGSAFAFRHYAITAGNFPVNPDTFFEAYVSPWMHSFPLMMGLFALCLFAYLAATYLLLESHNYHLQEIFRKRAIVAVLIVGLLEEIVLILGKSAAPRLWGELTSSLWGIFIQFGVGILTIAAVWFLFTRRFWWARSCAIVQVTLTIWAWGLAQFPYLVPPSLTVFNASAPESTLRFITIVLFFGALLLFPSLYYLLRIFKGGAFFGPKGHHG
jgi:cytochrome d ubiquinol oxidase subunit II